MSRERFEALVARESGDLLRYFLRRTDEREDAADLLADTLLVVWRRFDAVPADEREARMWMFGVARRVLSGHVRGRVRRSALADRLRDELAVHVPVDEPDPRVDEVRELLAGLTRDERDLLGLVHWEGFTLTEAARVLGARPGAVRMRYRRLKDRLRRELGERLAAGA